MAACLDCSTKHGLVCSRAYSCPQCHRYPLCWQCLDFATIINLDSISQPLQAKTSSMCFSCFQKSCPLDLSKTFEIIEPDARAGGEPKLSVVVAHGGGACRASFRAHARLLAQDGFRCVLMDLPGHGGRVKEPLTLDTAIAAIRQVTVLTCPNPADDPARRPVFFGANLGGYVGMEFAGRYPDMFRALCIVVACQNVGAGASLQATAPLRLFSWVAPFVSTERFLSLMMKDIAYSQRVGHGLVDFGVVKECSLGCSIYFQQAREQVVTLRSTDSISAMKNFHGDVWYAIAGSDRMKQDMAHDLLHVSKESCQSDSNIVRLTSYPGAMRFFTHDTRYYDTFVCDLKAFLGELASHSAPQKSTAFMKK